MVLTIHLRRNRHVSAHRKYEPTTCKSFFKKLNLFDYELQDLRKFDWAPKLENNKYFSNSDHSPTVDYKLIKKNRSRQEALSVHLNRRLLRTKRTLVLPAHVNLTAITNSYDVVHS